MGIVANGGRHEGHTLLSESAIRALNEPLTTGVDKVLLMNVTYGRGVMLRDTPLVSAFSELLRESGCHFTNILGALFPVHCIPV